MDCQQIHQSLADLAHDVILPMHYKLSGSKTAEFDNDVFSIKVRRSPIDLALVTISTEPLDQEVCLNGYGFAFVSVDDPRTIISQVVSGKAEILTYQLAERISYVDHQLVRRWETQARLPMGTFRLRASKMTLSKLVWDAQNFSPYLH